MAFCPAPGVLGQENVMKIRETVTGKRFRAALAGATIAVFLGVTGLVTAYAQGAPGQISPNPLDAIVAKLDQVLAALNATPATDVVLSTPFLPTVPLDSLNCLIANVGPTAFSVVTRVVRTDGVSEGGESSGTVDPGKARTLGLAPGQAILRCEFRVTGAPASSVRANITVGAGGRTDASADAR